MHLVQGTYYILGWVYGTSILAVQNTCKRGNFEQTVQNSMLQEHQFSRISVFFMKIAMKKQFHLTSPRSLRRLNEKFTWAWKYVRSRECDCSIEDNKLSRTRPLMYHTYTNAKIIFKLWLPIRFHTLNSIPPHVLLYRDARNMYALNNESISHVPCQVIESKNVSLGLYTMISFDSTCRTMFHARNQVSNDPTSTACAQGKRLTACRGVPIIRFPRPLAA